MSYCNFLYKSQTYWSSWFQSLFKKILTTLKKSSSVLEINENQVVRSQKFLVGMTRSQFQGTTNSRILSQVIISSKYSRNGAEKLSAIWNQRLITKQATAYLCTNAWTPLICTCVCGPDQEMYEWVWEFKQIKLKWCKYRTQWGGMDVVTLLETTVRWPTVELRW